MIFPPGRAISMTTPSPTGLAVAAMITGIVLVAALTARTAGVLLVTIRSTLELNQFCRQVWKALVATVSRAIFKDYALPLDVAECVKRFPQGIKVGCIQGRRNCLQYSDAIHLPGLLCGDLMRPHHRRAAQQPDELAPLSFDHLVGAGEQRRRHVEAEHFWRS